MLRHPLFVVYLEVLTIAKLDHQLNEEIRDKEIRLIGADGAQLGIVSSAQANAMAEEQGMDLVKISPNAVPPVCKIMDYSKFCFDQKKREKEAKKKDNEYYARCIKGTSSPSTKATYRKSKIDHAAAHDRNIESLKRSIESAKANLARERERAKKK